APSSRSSTPRASTTRCDCPTRTSTETAWPSSRATATPHVSSSPASRSAWSASTSRSPSRSPTTRSAAGRSPASATSTSTARSRSSSTPRSRRSRSVGRRASRMAPSSSSPRWTDAAHRRRGTTMFTLDDDDKVIVDAAREFSDKRIGPKAQEWDETHHFPKDVLREAAEMGMGAIYVSEDVGGSGMRRLDGVRIFEQLARGCPSVAAYLSIHNMCVWMIDEFGTDEQRQQWIPKLVSMELFASYCLTEPGAGSDAAALRTKAVREGDEYVLTGTKQFISGGGQSDVYVIMARTGDPGPKGISTFIVPADSEGLSFGPDERKMGWNAQPTAQVIMEGVRVPAANLIGGADTGGEGLGFTIAMRGLNGGRINIAACSLGGAQQAYSQAVAHLRDREAFGGALIDEPTIRFTLAE